MGFNCGFCESRSSSVFLGKWNSSSFVFKHSIDVYIVESLHDDVKNWPSFTGEEEVVKQLLKCRADVTLDLKVKPGIGVVGTCWKPQILAFTSFSATKKPVPLASC